eukprot:365309-Chlamydomonas_euryale.AAC.8
MRRRARASALRIPCVPVRHITGHSFPLPPDQSTPPGVGNGVFVQTRLSRQGLSLSASQINLSLMPSSISPCLTYKLYLVMLRCDEMVTRRVTSARLRGQQGVARASLQTGCRPTFGRRAWRAGTTHCGDQEVRTGVFLTHPHGRSRSSTRPAYWPPGLSSTPDEPPDHATVHVAMHAHAASTGCDETVARLRLGAQCGGERVCAFAKRHVALFTTFDVSGPRRHIPGHIHPLPHPPPLATPCKEQNKAAPAPDPSHPSLPPPRPPPWQLSIDQPKQIEDQQLSVCLRVSNTRVGATYRSAFAHAHPHATRIKLNRKLKPWRQIGASYLRRRELQWQVICSRLATYA